MDDPHKFTGRTNPYLVGAVFFVVPFLLTQVMSNTAVDNVFTPMASPAIAYVMPAGGYSVKDLAKMSWIPCLILGVVCVLFSMTVFPA